MKPFRRTVLRCRSCLLQQNTSVGAPITLNQARCLSSTHLDSIGLISIPTQLDKSNEQSQRPELQIRELELPANVVHQKLWILAVSKDGKKIENTFKEELAYHQRIFHFIKAICHWGYSVCLAKTRRLRTVEKTSPEVTERYAAYVQEVHMLINGSAHNLKIGLPTIG